MSRSVDITIVETGARITVALGTIQAMPLWENIAGKPDGKMFGGVINPSSSAPSNPDESMCYMAFQAGTYRGFGFDLAAGKLAFVTWDGSQWVADQETNTSVGFVEVSDAYKILTDAEMNALLLDMAVIVYTYENEWHNIVSEYFFKHETIYNEEGHLSVINFQTIPSIEVSYVRDYFTISVKEATVRKSDNSQSYYLTINDEDISKNVYDSMTVDWLLNRKANTATTLAGYGITDAYTKTQVDTMVSSAYRAAGSAASVADLPSLTVGNVGKVYNMTAAFTTTADFVEGAGKDYSAGTNVAIVDASPTAIPSYKYDVLGGFVDLSGKEDISNKVSAWSQSTNNTRYPSEKLVKDSLDTKLELHGLLQQSDLSFFDNAKVGDVFYPVTALGDRKTSGETVIQKDDDEGFIVLLYFENSIWFTDRYNKVNGEWVFDENKSFEDRFIIAVENATGGNLPLLTSRGSIEDSGHALSDFATAAQGALADTAYQKPADGIPASDIAFGVIPFDATYGYSLFLPATPISGSIVLSLADHDYIWSDAGSHYEIPITEDMVGLVAQANSSIAAKLAILSEEQRRFPTGGRISNPPKPTTIARGAMSNIDGLERNKYIYILSENQNGDNCLPQSLTLRKLRTRDKADKVSNAVNGNFAGLDSNGNLTDSGKSSSDFIEMPSGGSTGQVLKKTASGTEWANESGAVTDVTVGGTSVVSNGVAVVPSIPEVIALTTTELNNLWEAAV